MGVGVVGIGAGVFLATWGISFLWKYTPPEIRIANPEIRLVQPEALKIEPGQVTVKVEQQPPATSGVGGNTKTPTGDVIEREVTVFSNVRHGPGIVVTGWRYRDGSGGTYDPVALAVLVIGISMIELLALTL